MLQKFTKSVTIIGLGWLGLPLGLALHKQGWQVKGSQRVIKEALPFEARALSLPIHNSEQTQVLTALLNTQALIITLPPNKFESLTAYKQNVKALVTQALLLGVTHIIFTSSSSVFPSHSGYFDEACEPQPDSEQGKCLFELEQWLLSQSIRVDIVRLAGLVGGQRHPIKYLAGRTMQAGNSPVNLVHLDDVVQAISLLFEKPEGKRLFHLVAPEHPLRKDFYPQAAKAFGLAEPQFICDESDSKRLFIGNKICRELGFSYQFSSPLLMT